MSQQYGIQPPGPHVHGGLRPPARYLVLIDSVGVATALLFDAERRQLAEFDAGSEEVATMVRGLAPARDAGAAVWDDALDGSSAAERAAAEVYTLDL